MDWPLVALVAGTLAILVAFAGGLATRTEGWYRALRMPAWKPPDWAFGPIWAAILALTATAGALAWIASPDDRASLAVALGLNAALNIAWSVIFFRLRRPDWALAEVGLLWVSILLLMAVLGRVSVTSAALLLPYLGWVSVAALLNLRILRLNPDYARLREA